MGYFAGARDLRNLLAVAAMLRRLSDDSLHRGDRTLYRNAAEALETRARQLAHQVTPEQQARDDPRLPVDLLV